MAAPARHGLGATKRKSPQERSAALYKEIARRRDGKRMTTGDVAEQVESIIDELILQGMDRKAAAGLVIRMANEATGKW